MTGVTRVHCVICWHESCVRVFTVSFVDRSRVCVFTMPLFVDRSHVFACSLCHLLTWVMCSCVHCVICWQESCVRVLLFRGADRSILNYSNKNAFDSAIISGNTEIATIIQNFRQEDVGMLTLTYFIHKIWVLQFTRTDIQNWKCPAVFRSAATLVLCKWLCVVTAIVVLEMKELDWLFNLCTGCFRKIRKSLNIVVKLCVFCVIFPTFVSRSPSTAQWTNDIPWNNHNVIWDIIYSHENVFPIWIFYSWYNW